MKAHRQIRDAVPHDMVDGAEIVEHLQGPRLNPLGLGRTTGSRIPLDEMAGDATAGEIARQRESHRAGADDEHFGHDRVVCVHNFLHEHL